jgi:hypothetical protein
MLARWGKVEKRSHDWNTVRVSMLNPTIDYFLIEYSKIALRLGCYSKNETNSCHLCSIISTVEGENRVAKRSPKSSLAPPVICYELLSNS